MLHHSAGARINLCISEICKLIPVSFLPHFLAFSLLPFVFKSIAISWILFFHSSLWILTNFHCNKVSFQQVHFPGLLQFVTQLLLIQRPYFTTVMSVLSLTTYIFKSALKKFFRKQHKVPVFFERNYKTSHLQIQTVPVPCDMTARLKDVFQVC